MAFHSCRHLSGVVRRLGNSIGDSHGDAVPRPLDRLLFRPDVSPVGADRASVYALPPVAAARRWLLLLLSPLLSAQCESGLGRSCSSAITAARLDSPPCFVVANAQGQVLPCPRLL
jgi:hypothetical protein